jgi:hypothetical protein
MGENIISEDELGINTVADFLREMGLTLIPLWGIRDGHCDCPKGSGCESPGKHPKVLGWGNQDYQDTWVDFTGCNIGIRCDGDLAVVDVDQRNDGWTTWEQIDEVFPQTFCVTTGDGMHFYYRVDGIKSAVGGLGEGVDVKAGMASYVVGPGSTHWTGKMYRVHHGGEIVRLVEGEPAWSLLPRPGDRVRRPWAVSGPGAGIVTDDGGPIMEGTRNNTLFHKAGSLSRFVVNAGGQMEDVLAEMLEINRTRTFPPLREGVIRDMVQRVWDHVSDPNNDRPFEPPTADEELMEIARQMARQTRGTVVLVPEPESSIWNESKVLGAIRQWAWSVPVSEWGLLAAVLARVACEMDYRIVLDTGPLPMPVNLISLLEGQSGHGKSQTMGLAGMLVPEDQARWLPQGSGEGIPAMYGREPNKTEIEHGQTEFVRTAWQRGIETDEISEMEAITKRAGSTLRPILASAWSGSILGQQNATRERRRHVKPRSYRFCMVAGVLPTKAGFLVDDPESGIPQRLLWASVWRSESADPVPTEPFVWKRPPYNVHDAMTEHDPEKVSLPARAWAEFVAAKDEDRQSASGGSKGHRAALRVRVMAAVAWLHGRTELTDWDWDVAGEIVSHSAAVEKYVISVVEREKREANKEMGIAKGFQEKASKAVAERFAEEEYERVEKDLHSLLLQKAEFSWRDVPSSFRTPAIRHLTEAVLKDWEDSGRIAPMNVSQGRRWSVHQ